MTASGRTHAKRNDKPVIIAAILLGVITWFVMGNKNQAKPSARAASHPASPAEKVNEMTSSVAMMPSTSAAPQDQPGAAPTPRGTLPPPVVPGAAKACPAQQPRDGEWCQHSWTGILSCGYGDPEHPNVCYCGAHDAPNGWKCPIREEMPAVDLCPPVQPETGMDCAPKGQKCLYGDWPKDMSCTCSGSDRLRWSCGRRKSNVH